MEAVQTEDAIAAAAAASSKTLSVEDKPADDSTGFPLDELQGVYSSCLKPSLCILVSTRTMLKLVEERKTHLFFFLTNSGSA
jgi:hypothetical protein